MGSERNGCASASLAEKRALGSILRHLLRKSMKCLLLLLMRAFRFVIFGVKILQSPVLRFLRFPSTSSPTYSQISSNSTNYFVKYLCTSLPFSIIQEGQGPRNPWILASIPTTLSLSNNTCPVNNSAIMQPKLQISILSVYSQPRITSGAR